MNATSCVWGACLLACALSLGCRDASEEALRRCKELEAQGKLERALAACTTAARADPSGKAGIEALERVASLNAKASDQAEQNVASAYEKARIELLGRELADAGEAVERARIQAQIDGLRARSAPPK